MPPIILTIQVDDRGTPTIKSFAGEVQKAGQSINQGATQPFQQATKASEGFLGSLGGVLRAGAGFAVGFAGVQGLAGLFASAASGAAGFEAALANVNTLGIKSVTVQQQLREQVLRLPPALGSSTDLARGLYEVLSSGVEPAKAVAFLEQSALLAKAGLASLDVTTIALTKTMAAYNIPVEEAGRVSDILFKTVEIGQGNLNQFAGALPQVTQIAASLGISLLDTSNAMATLTQTFRNADTAATGFRSLLQQLIQNSDQFLALGINIRKVISEEGLLGVVKVLQDVSQGSSERLRTFINDIEGFNAALALTGPQFNTLLANQQKFAQATGSVAAGVQEQAKTTQAAWAEFVNSTERLTQQLAPPLLDFATKVFRIASEDVASLGAAVRGELLPHVVKSIETLTASEDALNNVSLAYLKTSGATAETAQQTVLAKTAQEALNKVYADANAAALGLSEGLKKLRETAGAAIPEKELEQRIKAVIDNLQAMQLSGVFSAKQIRDAYENAAKVIRDEFGGLVPQFKEFYDGYRAGAEGSAAGISRAFQDSGLKTRAQLQETAIEAINRFKQILDSGQATPQQLLAEWQKVLKQITDAGFKTLPPGMQEIANRMREIFRKLGIEMPKLVLDAFGQVDAGGKKLADSFDTTFRTVNETIAKFGANFRQHLDATQVKAAEDLGIIARRAIETGEALDEGLGGGAERARDRTLTALDQAAKAAERVRISFEQPFSTTKEGLLKELTQARQEFQNVQDVPGARGFAEFARARIKERIAAITDRLAALGIIIDEVTKNPFAKLQEQIPPAGTTTGGSGTTTTTTGPTSPGGRPGGGAGFLTPGLLGGGGGTVTPGPASGAPVGGFLRPGDVRRPGDRLGIPGLPAPTGPGFLQFGGQIYVLPTEAAGPSALVPGQRPGTAPNRGPVISGSSTPPITIAPPQRPIRTGGGGGGGLGGASLPGANLGGGGGDTSSPAGPSNDFFSQRGTRQVTIQTLTIMSPGMTRGDAQRFVTDIAPALNEALRRGEIG